MIQCVMGTIVDDLIWAVEDTAAYIIDEIEKELTFGRKGELTFRFCGRGVTTNEEGAIRVTCRDTTMKIGEIDIDKNRSKLKGEKVNSVEKEQLDSVVGSLNWISRVC